jgi:hypothetical protein
MFVKDDQIYLYYTGTQNRHGEKFAHPSIGLATLPADRFVGLRPTDPAKAGILDTVPFHFSGGDLLINGDGDIRVEVLDEKGNVLPGFERDKCRQTPCGPTRRHILWAEKGLRKCMDKSPIALRFIVEKGVLFAYQIPETRNP